MRNKIKQNLDKNLIIGNIAITCYIVVNLIALNIFSFLILQNLDSNWPIYTLLCLGIFMIPVTILNILTFQKNKKYKSLLFIWTLWSTYMFVVPIIICIMGILVDGSQNGYGWIKVGLVIIICSLAQSWIPLAIIYSKIIKKLIKYISRKIAPFPIETNPLYLYTNIK